MQHAAVTTAAQPAPWAHLDIPHRMALVIDRYRFSLDGTVTERNFEAEHETCDLSLEELRANIGKAQQLIEAGVTATAAYDRAARVSEGARLVLGLMPQIGAMHEMLR